MIKRKQVSVDSFLQRSFGFPDLHRAVAAKKQHKKKFTKKHLIITSTSLHLLGGHERKAKTFTRASVWDSLGGGEQLAAVGGQAVDGTVVSPDLAEGC